MGKRGKERVARGEVGREESRIRGCYGASWRGCDIGLRPIAVVTVVGVLSTNAVVVDMSPDEEKVKVVAVTAGGGDAPQPGTSLLRHEERLFATISGWSSYDVQLAV